MANYVLNGTYNGRQIVVGGSDAWGGALSVFVMQEPDGTFYNYMDNTSPGRLIQTALGYDLIGEGNNPTEAGAFLDFTRGTESSVVFTEYVAGQNLVKFSQMANWLPIPGMLHDGNLSDTFLGSVYTLGWNGHGNVLHASISIIPTGADHFDAGIEIVTTHLPANFNVIRSYDPSSTGWYTDVHLEQQPIAAAPNFAWSNHAAHDAIVAATPDGLHAMGIWSPDAGGHYAVDYNASVGNPAFGHELPTVKLDAWDSRDPVPGQPMIYNDVYVVVGDIWQVKDTLHQLWMEWSGLQ